MASRKRKRILWASAVVAMLLGLLIPPASAGPAADRSYEATVMPSTDTAGATTLYTLTLRNDSSASTIGAVDWTVPPQYTVLGLQCPPLTSATEPPSPAELSCNITSSDGNAWTVTLVGSTLQWRIATGTEKLDPGASMQIGVWTTAPSVSGCTEIDWGGTHTTTSYGDLLQYITVKSSTAVNSSDFTATSTTNLVVTVAGSTTATQLAITSVYDQAAGLLLGAETGHFVARPSSNSTSYPFTVVVEAQDASGHAAPVCQDTTVTLAANGSGSLGGATLGTIPAGSESVTIAGVTYNNGGNSETVTITASDSSPGVLASGSAMVDFNSSLVVASGSPGTSGSLTTNGSSCTPTSTTPFCVTVTLPNGWSQTAALFVESCPSETDAECPFGLLASFIADLKAGDTQLYDNSSGSFFTIDIGCDRSVCTGGNLKNYVISINTDEETGGSFGYVPSPACTSSVNDRVDPYDPAHGQFTCTDYNWAHRDNNQDTWLRLRAAGIDARGKM